MSEDIKAMAARQLERPDLPHPFFDAVAEAHPELAPHVQAYLEGRHDDPDFVDFMDSTHHMPLQGGSGETDFVRVGSYGRSPSFHGKLDGDRQKHNWTMKLPRRGLGTDARASTRKVSPAQVANYLHATGGVPNLLHAVMGVHHFSKDFLKDAPQQMSRTDNSLPPEVSKEAVGNALAKAAKEAQQPHGAVYASSSEREGSTLEHALENYKKDAHSGLLKTAGRLGVAYPAIGTWSDGAEESSLTETHPDETERVGAILGLKHRQKGVALFKPDEAGPDAQHIVSFTKPLPLAEAHKRLLKNGIEFATFLPTDHRPDLIDTIHVLSNGPEDTQTTAERLATAFQKEEGSDYFQNKGYVNVPSAPTREGAAKLFKELLKRQSAGLS